MTRSISILIALIGTMIPVGFGTFIYVAAKGLPSTYIVSSTQPNTSHQFYLNGELKGDAGGFCFTTENAHENDENAGENIITLVRQDADTTHIEHISIDESNMLPSSFVSPSRGSDLGLVALASHQYPDLAKRFGCI